MIITWLMLLLLGIVSFGLKNEAWFIYHGITISWLIITITSLVFVIYIVTKYAKDIVVATIMLGGYFMRIAMLFIDRHFYNHLGFILLHRGGGDTEAFYSRGWHLYHGNIAPERAGSYGRLIANIFEFFGPSRIIVQYANLLFGVTAVFLGYAILRKFTENRTALIIFLSTAMFVPHFASVNVIMLREAIIAMFIAMSLYFFADWFKKGNPVNLVLSLAAIIIASTYHSASIAPALGYALCVIFYDRKSNSFRFKADTVLWVLIVGITVFTIDWLFGEAVFGRFSGIETLEDVMDAGPSPMGAAAYSVSIETGVVFLDFLINTPIRMIYLIMSPMPWYWRGPMDVVAFALSSMFFGFAYFKVIQTLRKPDGQDTAFITFLLLTSLTSVFLFGWGVSNAGTAMRHRDKFFIQHMLMLAACYAKDAPGLLGMLPKGLISDKNMKKILSLMRGKN